MSLVLAIRKLRTEFATHLSQKMHTLIPLLAWWVFYLLTFILISYEDITKNFKGEGEEGGWQCVSQETN